MAIEFDDVLGGVSFRGAHDAEQNFVNLFRLFRVPRLSVRFFTRFFTGARGRVPCRQKPDNVSVCQRMRWQFGE